MAIQTPSPSGASTKHQPREPIPEEFLTQVNERADLLDVIGRSVKLKKSGANNWLGLCPFHNEKGPSFTVTPNKGMYHCFGCGASGSAITFLMEHDGTPFRDAVKELALGAGLTLPSSLQDDAHKQTVQVETGPLYSAMEAASRFFRHVLRHDQTARDYLRTRGINQASATKFQIGAAPNEWRSLSEAFADYASNPYVVQSGLVREKESPNDANKVNRYDTFRGRIMFPVRDTRGRINAFGGRILGDGDPKYLNSPESPIFNKSGSLYGLFEARESIRKKKMAIVVEGYIDVVMLSQSGVENAVACMGTSLTRSHVERLLTQTEAVAFAFDGDAAGRKAAWRAMETCIPLIEDQHDVRFLILPGGKDPDDLSREEGAEAFDERVLKAPSLSEFLISELHLKHNALATAEDRARFAAEGSQVAGRLNYHSKLRGLLLQRISEESKMPGSVIKSLQQASNSRPAGKSLWSTLSHAARLAPGAAIKDRDLLLELLDLDDAQENAFAQTLNTLPAEAVEEHPQDPSWLVARDTMAAAVDMIGEHREQQIRDDVRSQFQKGEITESDYLRMSLSLGDQPYPAG